MLEISEEIKERLERLPGKNWNEKVTYLLSRISRIRQAHREEP